MEKILIFTVKHRGTKIDWTDLYFREKQSLKSNSKISKIYISNDSMFIEFTQTQLAP